MLVQGVCYQRQPEEIMLRYVAALTFECVDALHQHVFHVQEFLDRRQGILKVSRKMLTPVRYNTPDGRQIG